MSTMTSLEAQSQFGRLIDSSQREPVTITRHGRPVAVMLSYDEYASAPKTIPFTVARLISESYPLRGEAASQAIARQLASMSTLAEREGLTESDIMRMADEE